MLGPGSRDRERRPPSTPLLPPGGGFRSEGQANGENWIVKRKRRFQMRSRQSKPTAEHVACTAGLVTKNEPAGIVALTAHTQQILVQMQTQIQFASVHVNARLPIGNVKVLRGETELLPQLSCPGIGMARFRGRLAFDKSQRRAQGAAKFELLSLAFGVVREQRQLIQRLLKLRGSFRNRRTGGGPMTGLAPVGDGFFNEPSLGVMLGEEFGLAVHQLGGMG